MKTWKILLVVALVTLATGLVTASVFASAVRPAAAQYGTYNGVASPYGGNAGGMMRGGMMGNGYSSYSGYPSGNGYGRCMGGWGWP
jgi:hypothetical protein